MASFEDMEKMAQEMKKMLQETKEVDCLTEIDVGLQKLKEIRAEGENQIKKDIAALIALKSEAEESAVIGQSDETYHNEVQQVTNQLEDAKSHNENIKKDCGEVNHKLDAAKMEQEKLQQHKERVREQTTQALPKLRHDVNLYSNISNIRWQYDCEPTLIKGYVSNKTDVKPFSLDSKEYSQYFIANYLWDIMEVDW